MKLLQKSNRTYFLISASAFIIAGIILYFVISFFFKDQLNEKLISDIKVIERTIANKGILPNYYPFIEIEEVSGISERSFETIDTLIFDEVEKKDIPFRQISIIKSIDGKSYLIAARDTLIEEDDLLGVIAIVTGSVFILLLICLYFMNRKISLNTWKPFYKTLEELKEFSHDRLDFRLSKVNQPDEFRELNNTLDLLTQKVISDYQSLKRFTEDASHEIQNPLAVIQSKLEALMQNPELKEDQAELLNSAYSNTLRISKLTQTLLLLTKIANDQFPEKIEVNISELLEEKIKLFEDHINVRSLVLNKEIDPECYLDTNYFLAESLITNLIGNAVKHCNTEGIINILLKNNQMEISNTGDRFEEPFSKIFERFYKINKSSDSHGLGLAIVKEICNLNRWHINYEYTNDLHKFIVNF
jgi:two-component system OmpR family sensor kinase